MYYQRCAYFHCNWLFPVHNYFVLNKSHCTVFVNSYICYSLNLCCVDEIPSSVAIPAWPKPACLTMYHVQIEVEYKVTSWYIVMSPTDTLRREAQVQNPYIQGWPVYTCLSEVMRPLHAVGLHCKAIRSIVRKQGLA